MDSHSLASLFLVGQPPLRDTLSPAGNQAFYQRLTVRYHRQPLDLPAQHRRPRPLLISAVPFVVI